MSYLFVGRLFPVKNNSLNMYESTEGNLLCLRQEIRLETVLTTLAVFVLS